MNRGASNTTRRHTRLGSWTRRQNHSKPRLRTSLGALLAVPGRDLQERRITHPGHRHRIGEVDCPRVLRCDQL